MDPTTEIPEKDYYDDYETLLKGLMAAYAPLQWPDFVFGEYGPLAFVSDVMSDDVRVGGANETDIPYLQLMRKFSATPNHTPSVLWVVLYSGVYRANTVLQYVDTAEGVSGATRSESRPRPTPCVPTIIPGCGNFSEMSPTTTAIRRGPIT